MESFGSSFFPWIVFLVEQTIATGVEAAVAWRKKRRRRKRRKEREQEISSGKGEFEVLVR